MAGVIGRSVTRRVRAAALAAVVVAGACRAPRDAGRTIQDRVAHDIPLLEKAVGVPFRKTPTVQVRTRDEVRKFLIAQLDDSVMRRELAGREAAYKVLGLIPDTLQLRPFLVELYTEQIVGYYDPATKVLYVVDGAPDDIVGMTVMHELVHALQDQYVNLDSLMRQSGNDDRAAAAQAVIEGQAVYEQAIAMVGGSGNLAARLPGGWDEIRKNIRDARSTQPVLSSAPMVIQEEALFPYLSGADFVRRFKDRHGSTLPLTDMPVSTEQVLHDEAFAKTPRDAPVPVRLPSASNVVYENTLGEFDTRLFLFAHLSDVGSSARAAAGWAGDRYQVVSLPGGRGIAWATVWDSAVDAAEFVDALTQMVRFRYDDPVRTAGPAGARRFHGGGRSVAIIPAERDGRNVVVYLDGPQGSLPVLDLARVSFAP